MQQSILTVGDGNLSYSISLLAAIPNLELTATTYDDLECLKAKYGAEKMTETVEKITSKGSRVVHGVDARKLGESLDKQDRFDRIVFMHPLVPNVECAVVARKRGTAFATVLINRRMIVEFLDSASTFLAPGGEVHITMKDVHPYTTWRLDWLGRFSESLRFIRLQPFDASVAGLYESRNVERDKDFPLTRSVTFVYAKKQVDDKDNHDELATANESSGTPSAKRQRFVQSVIGSCEMCGAQFTSERDQSAHIESRKHRKAAELEAAWLDYMKEWRGDCHV